MFHVARSLHLCLYSVQHVKWYLHRFACAGMCCFLHELWRQFSPLQVSDYMQTIATSHKKPFEKSNLLIYFCSVLPFFFFHSIFKFSKMCWKWHQFSVLHLHGERVVHFKPFQKPINFLIEKTSSVKIRKRKMTFD